MSSPATSTALSLLLPVFFLNAWTLFIETIMLYYRIPLLARLDIPSGLTHEQINRLIPASVRCKADNFNHLMEQPMNFYVVTLATALGHYLSQGEWQGRSMDLALSWLYVVLRVVHSYYHLNEEVKKRFLTFIASSMVLGVMTGTGAWRIWENSA